jgi:hypothetical protein
MIPKLGPTGDVDLFFSTYIVLASVTGRYLDDAGIARVKWLEGALVASALGAGLTIQTVLVDLWLPPNWAP